MTELAQAGRHCLGLLLFVSMSSVSVCTYADEGEKTEKTEGLALRLDSNFSVRSDVWSGSRQLDDAGTVGQASFWGRTKIDLEKAGTVVADAWLSNQTRTDPDSPRGRLRELYWRYNQGPAELKLGRQMMTWGRADGLNPTDNLSPRDFTLLTPEDGDQRYGNEAAQLSIDTSIGNFVGVWFPHAASHTIPLLSLQGVSYTVEKPPRNSQWALKWETSKEGVDGSVSYFHGIDPMPDLVFNGAGPSGINIAVRNQSINILGADLSLTRGAFVWRAEMAATQTDSTGSQDFTHKKPQVWLVAGGEYSFDNGTTLGIQGTVLHVKDFFRPDSISDPATRALAWWEAATSNQTSANQYGMTWRLAHRWWNDTLLGETSGVFIWSSHSGIWRTKLDYAIDDHWHVQAGADYYFGRQESFFGQLRQNRLVYAQLRYGW